MTAGATWTMPPEILANAQDRWNRVDKAIKQGILAGEILVQSKLKIIYLSGYPVKRRKGNLSRATFIEPTSVSGFTGYRGYVFIGKEAPYAKWINDGTSPYIIRAHGATLDDAAASGLDVSFRKRGKGGRFIKQRHMLRFVIGGKVIYRREVHHPGIAAVHFMETALAANAHEIVTGIQGRVNKALIGGG